MAKAGIADAAYFVGDLSSTFSRSQIGRQRAGSTPLDLLGHGGGCEIPEAERAVNVSHHNVI